jgi:very-short-patch-repair endonuclease
MLSAINEEEFQNAQVLKRSDFKTLRFQNAQVSKRSGFKTLRFQNAQT